MTSRSRRKKEASKQRIVNKSLNNSARNLRNPPEKKNLLPHIEPQQSSTPTGFPPPAAAPRGQHAASHTWTSHGDFGEMMMTDRPAGSSPPINFNLRGQ